MDGLSIHQRSRPINRAKGEKLNMSGRKKRSTVERVISAINGHLLAHPRDAMSSARVGKLRALLATLPAAEEAVR